MQEMILEPARETPVAGEFDICVIGGSCTGVFAAVSAARLGAQVALVEHHGQLGGVATSRLVNVWHSIFDESGDRQIIGGLSLELIERLKAVDGVIDKGHNENYQFVLNSACLAIALDQLVLEHPSIQTFLHTRFVACARGSSGDPEAALIEDIGGRRAIRASFFIDASGDSVMARTMGLPFIKEDSLQPPTMAAILCGLDKLAATNPDRNIRRAVYDSAYPDALPEGFYWDSPVPGTMDSLRQVFATRVHHTDCGDPDQLSRAEMEGRKQVRDMVNIYRREFIGGSQVGLVALPACIGIRETRKTLCEYTLSETDILEGVPFNDTIGNGSYRVDIHDSDGPGILFRYMDGRQVWRSPTKRNEGRWREERQSNPTYYQIPYRCLVPKNSRNLLVAGRAIGADRGAFGAIRVMINCNQTGEAAGVAAWQSLKDGVEAKAVDISKVRNLLRNAGSILFPSSETRESFR